MRPIRVPDRTLKRRVRFAEIMPTGRELQNLDKARRQSERAADLACDLRCLSDVTGEGLPLGRYAQLLAILGLVRLSLFLDRRGQRRLWDGRDRPSVGIE